MYKSSKIVLSLFLILTLGLPALSSADMVRERILTNAAEANFLTHSGCEDVSVGVSVTEKHGTINKEAIPPTAILSIFGSFIDVCEFGSSTSFFGTTTVSAAEFEQSGVENAKLVKTFTVDGNEIHIFLEWSGIPPTGGERLKIHDKDARVKKTWDVENRNTQMSGVFVVNGINRFSENSLVNAQLEVIKTDSKTTVK